ncbi:hypothetical protein BU25DRAFT_411005 [Macroventuria anomochaeta]|uniref:Uncharacterized protein n=1 Tax=Macroventuria anomochaeta TaxID=301207 RepID=A0ACB6RZS0_9PLEO|nr:uncharacterized protein BU25DRAFT_411005 [Macroventuria anomochaeta]KAF2627401.1 hypothetical protein BU25DRAFT_411005 [Macroventuria anomochaeta]
MVHRTALDLPDGNVTTPVVLAASPSLSILSLLVSASTCLPTILPLLDSQRGSNARSRGKRWRDIVITSGQALKKVLIGVFPFCIDAVDPLAGGIVSRNARCTERLRVLR